MFTTFLNPERAGPNFAWNAMIPHVKQMADIQVGLNVINPTQKDREVAMDAAFRTFTRALKDSNVEAWWDKVKET